MYDKSFIDKWIRECFKNVMAALVGTNSRGHTDNGKR